MMPVHPFSDTIQRQVRKWLDHPHLADVGDRVVIQAVVQSTVMITDWSLMGETVRQLVRGIASQRPGRGIEMSAAITTDATLRLTLVARGEGGRPIAISSPGEMFDHGDDASSSKYGATGIEFPLAQKLAELLGGSIVAAHSPPDGAAVVLTLPSMTRPERLAA